MSKKNLELENCISEIIKIPSQSGHERNLADHLFTSMLVMGHKPVKQSGNVITRIKGTDSTRAIVFNAHMDTVSSGALSQWKYPPFGKESGIIHDGKIYGLGASDDKASLASLLFLSEAYLDEQPPIDIWIVFVTREETGGQGTQAFLEWFRERGWFEKYEDIAVVICEPTNLDEARIGHRGNLHAEVSVTGTSGYGSEPHLVEIQAIQEAYKIIDALKKLEKEWSRKFADPVIGAPSIGITSITAGDRTSPNKFPDTCSFTIDVRTTPKLHKKAFVLLTQLIQKYNAKIETVYTPAPPGHTNRSAKIVRVTESLVPKIASGTASTDLCFFSDIGIPGVILGPGNHEVTHKPNEFCELKNIPKAAELYKKIVLNYSEE